MNARVRADYRWDRLQAFDQREYLKSEWRPVPAEFETQASMHPFLEVDTGAHTEPTEVTYGKNKTRRSAK